MKKIKVDATILVSLDFYIDDEDCEDEDEIDGLIADTANTIIEDALGPALSLDDVSIDGWQEEQ